MKYREITNSRLTFQSADRSAPIVLLVIFSLALAGCGAAPENTLAPSTSSLPAVQPSTQAIPSTTLPSAIPTSLPTPSPTTALPFPDPAGYAWTPVVSGLEAPVDIQNAGDGS